MHCDEVTLSCLTHYDTGIFVLGEPSSSSHNFLGQFKRPVCPMRRTRAPVPAVDDASSAEDDLTTETDDDYERTPAAPAPGKRGRGGVVRERSAVVDSVEAGGVADPAVGAGAGAGAAADADMEVTEAVTDGLMPSHVDAWTLPHPGADNDGVVAAPAVPVGAAGGRGHVCGECGKGFSRNLHLVAHFRVHTGGKPFACNDCGKAFAFKGNLTAHRRAHTGERHYPCTVCDKAFKNPVSLKEHIRRAHTGERPFVCEHCGKGFATSSGLTLHRRKHTGERPFACDVCGKGFTSSGDLSKHKRVHAPVPVVSDVRRADDVHGSGGVYRERNAVVEAGVVAAHVLDDLITVSSAHYSTTTKTFKCVRCPSEFAMAWQLSLHTRMHTGEAPAPLLFACYQCGQAFFEPSALDVHRRDHPVSPPFLCQYCDQNFPIADALVDHIREAHVG